MLILLPPSEGKAPPARRGRAVDLASLSFTDLSETRHRLLDALAAASARPDACERLGVGTGLAAEVARNIGLRELPARPATEVYTGVLYAALDWPGLPGTARRRAGSRLVVVSALWGALRPRDRIPPYRLSMSAGVPGAGRLPAVWRPVLAPVLAEAAGRRGVIVDCRSQTYATAWSPRGEQAARTATVRVWQDGPGGRSVVSHLAKHTRGEIARDLLVHGTEPRSVPELAEELSRRWDVRPVPPSRTDGPWSLDVLVGC